MVLDFVKKIFSTGSDYLMFSFRDGEGERDLNLIKILDQESLRLCGGILFRFGRERSVSYLGLIPGFVNGERGYHYQIKLPCEEKYQLTGNLTAEGDMTLFYKTPPEDEMRFQFYRECFQSAGGLFQSHISFSLSLDSVSQYFLKEQNLNKGKEDIEFSDLILI